MTRWISGSRSIRADPTATDHIIVAVTTELATDTGMEGMEGIINTPEVTPRSRVT